MNNFKCVQCQNDYFNLGDAISSCPKCGTLNHALPSPKTYWKCVKCKHPYSTAAAVSFSKCPKCGHVNKDFNQSRV